MGIKLWNKVWNCLNYFNLNHDLLISDENKDSEDKDDADKSGSNKAVNLRKNIRDVIDENQLDPATLAAQREEAERLKRVQEQQQRLKEVKIVIRVKVHLNLFHV